MLVYFALGNAKFWRQVHCPTPTPDARYFASQWNIGFRLEIYGDSESRMPWCIQGFEREEQYYGEGGLQNLRGTSKVLPLRKGEQKRFLPC